MKIANIGFLAVIGATLLGGCAGQPQTYYMDQGDGRSQSVTFPNGTVFGGASGRKASSLAGVNVPAWSARALPRPIQSAGSPGCSRTADWRIPAASCVLPRLASDSDITSQCSVGVNCPKKAWRKFVSGIGGCRCSALRGDDGSSGWPRKA